MTAKSDSFVEVLNCGHTHPIAVHRSTPPFSVDSNSIISITNHLVLKVLNPDNDCEPHVGATVRAYINGDEEETFGTTDEDGIFGPVQMPRAMIYGSGIDWYDPYIIKINPTETPHSEFILTMDTRKELTVYSGGDSDYDGIADSAERSLNLFVTPSIGHCSDPSQIVTDMRSADGSAVERKSDDVLVSSNRFNRKAKTNRLPHA